MQPTAIDKLIDGILSLIESGSEMGNIAEMNIETLSLAKAIKAYTKDAKIEAIALTEVQIDSYALQAGYRLLAKLGAK